MPTLLQLYGIDVVMRPKDKEWVKANKEILLDIWETQKFIKMEQ